MFAALVEVDTVLVVDGRGRDRAQRLGLNEQMKKCFSFEWRRECHSPPPLTLLPATVCPVVVSNQVTENFWGLAERSTVARPPEGK